MAAVISYRDAPNSKQNQRDDPSPWKGSRKGITPIKL